MFKGLGLGSQDRVFRVEGLGCSRYKVYQGAVFFVFLREGKYSIYMWRARAYGPKGVRSGCRAARAVSNAKATLMFTR